MITIKNLIKYITSGALSRPAGAFCPNNLIKIHKIEHIIHPKLKKTKTNIFKYCFKSCFDTARLFLRS